MTSPTTSDPTQPPSTTPADLAWLDAYDVEWDRPSSDVREAMPCGGGGVGLVVWVERGELLCYLDRSGSFDEHNQMLKLGRVRVRLEPDLVSAATHFSQRLHLADGSVTVTAVGAAGRAQLRVWVEVDRPVVHVEVEADVPVTLEAHFETWRTEPHPLSRAERMACFSFANTDSDEVAVVRRADVVEPGDDRVRWYHRLDNSDLLFDKTLVVQHLDHVADQLENPQRDRIFGGQLSGPGLRFTGTATGRYGRTPFTGWRLASSSPALQHRVDVALQAGRYPAPQGWHHDLDQLDQLDPGEAVEEARAATTGWWQQFWRRSRIVLRPAAADPADPVWQVGRNAALFRHLLGCNAGGDFPTKFNGGLFTWDPDLDTEDPTVDRTPDHRNWGGGSTTLQNQRLVHFPMLPAGDQDLLTPQLDLYLRALVGAELRTRVYWGNEGASFTEQLEDWGLPCLHVYDQEWGHYGVQPRPGDDHGTLLNPYCAEQYDTMLEFCLMVLDLHAYTGNDIARYLPLVDACVIFFDEHYRQRAERDTGAPLSPEGQLIIDHSTALETYKDALNPTPVVSGLRVVTERLLALPTELGSVGQREGWERIRVSVPEVGRREQSGVTTLAPAWSWSHVQNEEMPQLYPVFPWGLHRVGRPDLQVAVDTFHHGADIDVQRGVVGWKQDPIWAARLGLTDEAAELVVAKLSDAPHRYPAFWGPGFDWTPDHNHGGSGLIALQEMLLSVDGDVIHLGQAWPADWDVEFRLHAPGRTVVEGSIVDGVVRSLSVEPAQRRSDVIVHPLRRAES